MRYKFADYIDVLALVLMTDIRIWWNIV